MRYTTSFNVSDNLGDHCEEYRLGLNQLNDGTGRLSIPLQDEDHSGNDPQLIAGFLRLCSGMFPERFRSVSVTVGSKEIRLVYTEHPKYGNLSCWISGTVFNDPAFNLLGNLCYKFLVDSRNGCVSWLAVLRMFFLCFSCNSRQFSFISQCRPFKDKCPKVMKTAVFSYF